MKLDDYERRIADLSENTGQPAFDELLMLDREIRGIVWCPIHHARAKQLADKAFGAASAMNPQAQRLYRFNASPPKYNNPVR